MPEKNKEIIIENGNKIDLDKAADWIIEHIINVEESTENNEDN